MVVERPCGLQWYSSLYVIHSSSNYVVEHRGRLMNLCRIGAALQASSYSVAQILVARWFTGIGTGIETSTVPMYQSELCEANKRGRLVSSEPMFVGVGKSLDNVTPMVVR